MLLQIIDNDRLGPTIFDMHWARVSVAESAFPLLTSDRPIDMPHGLNDKKRAYIALPVSPTMFFVASYDSTRAGRLQALDPTRLVRALNLGIVSRARKYVWGIDDKQSRFVENHMSSHLDKPILTEEQRVAAIDALRIDTKERPELSV